MRIDRPRQAAAEMLGSLGRSVLLSPGGSLPLPLLGDPDADILAALRDTYCSYYICANCSLAAASFFSFASLNARVWWIHSTFLGRSL